MSVASSIKSIIETLDEDKIITYDDFKDLGSFPAIAMNLSRLQKAGVLVRLSKGRYYKPKLTKFGKLAPSENEILRSVLAKGGYISGPAALNSFGLSTQVPSEITIGGSKSNRKLQLGNIRIKFVKGLDTKGIHDPSIINVIEALRFLKKIPDRQMDQVFLKIKSTLENLSEDQQSKLVDLALRNRPSVRALIGALLEQVNTSSLLIRKLRESLNPITVFKLNIPETLLPNKNSWRIQ